MEAPYLVINDRKVQVDQVYWTVSKIDFSISEHTAANENNVSYNCYFDDKAQALVYQKLATLLDFIAPIVRDIERRTQGDGFRLRDLKQ